MSTATDYKPPAELVRRLREETGAGMMDCRNALLKANGDFESAKGELNEMGAAQAAKKQTRAANEGLIGSYIHAGGKLGALIEVNCETDFVARNDRFRELVRDLAMHVAATSPQYLNREAVPPEAVEEAKANFYTAFAEVRGSEADIQPLVEAKLNKWFEERVLLEQRFIKDEDVTISELIGSVVGVLGEKIQIRRFAKFVLGEQ